MGELIHMPPRDPREVMREEMVEKLSGIPPVNYDDGRLREAFKKEAVETFSEGEAAIAGFMIWLKKKVLKAKLEISKKSGKLKYWKRFRIRAFQFSA